MMRALLALVVGLAASAVLAADSQPNIIYVLCDDLGYGDVHCLNSSSKIATPELDKLAAAGMKFTDVHSGSAVCTPTRYGVITGRYAWRSKLQSGVLGGLSPRLIEPDRLTVASLLKEHGYHTACIGKWHLGMNWVKKPGKQVTELNIEKADQVNNVDYTQAIAEGPNAVGFDFYFGISASLDMVPYTFIKNNHVATDPTDEKSFPMMPGKPASTRKGPAAPKFDAADVLPEFTQQAVDYVRSRAADSKGGKPFFLYLPLASPHTPIAPTKEWQGRSGLNPYADFVMQTDWSIGQVVAAVDAAGIGHNTLIIVTSDNGCSPQADFPALLAKGHNPSHVFRGHKADIFDGGHRIPFLARWPAKVKAGGTSDQLLCLTDFMATAADIIDAKLPPTAAEDSVSFLPALEGTAKEPLREAVVHHSINGSFAIRQGDWKLELCGDSGGWSAPRPNAKGPAKDLPSVQLYNLKDDIGETKNVADSHPDVVTQLTELLEKYIEQGRSTPGAKQQNAVGVKIRK